MSIKMSLQSIIVCVLALVQIGMFELSAMKM